MRKKSLIAASAAVALAASGGLAYAGSNQDDPAPEDAGQSDHDAMTVTLPSGDQVRMLPDGSLNPIPAEGRENVGFFSPVLPSGEQLVVPADYAGEDLRLYSIDRLLQAGYTDASEVASVGELGDDPASASAEAEDTVEVTFQHEWFDGEAPSNGNVFWTDLNDEERFDFVPIDDDGVGTVQLEPGEYLFMHGLSDGIFAGDQTSDDDPDNPQSLHTQDHVDLTEDTELLVEADDAEEVSLEVEGVDTEAHSHEFNTFSIAGDRHSGMMVDTPGDTEFYVVPREEIADRTTGASLVSELSDGNGDTYSVVDYTDEGLEGAELSVAMDDLAERNVTYSELGGEAVEMERLNSVNYSMRGGASFALPSAPVEVPSTRTEYYSATEGEEWLHIGEIPGETGNSGAIVFRDMGELAPEQTEDEWFDTGVVSLGLGDPEYVSGVLNHSQEVGLPPGLTSTPLMMNPHHASDFVRDYGLEGESSITPDDDVADIIEDGSTLDVLTNSYLDGRFTITHEATRDVEWTHLGTESTVTWEADIEPDDEILGVSVVELDIEGNESGYVTGGETYDATLDFVTQPGAVQRDAADMTFEVSYDDGETWEEVAIDREGNQAVASVEPPEDADFGSVRFTAEDDAGQTVEHSTIRSFGIN